MNRCKNCKHWDAAIKEPDDLPNIGICRAVSQYWDATKWADDYESRVLKPEYENKLAFAQDGSDYRADLITLPEFGCVQFEQGETK